MIEIREVTTKKELKQFVQFYYDLYRGNDCAVPFLYSDEMATLRSDKNPSFECCESAVVPMSAGIAIRCASVGSILSMISKCPRPC